MFLTEIILLVDCYHRSDWTGLTPEEINVFGLSEACDNDDDDPDNGDDDEYGLSDSRIISYSNFEFMQTALHIPCKQSNLEYVEMLLAAGVDVNAEDDVSICY